MRYLLALSLLFCAWARADCATYASEVVLTGKLVRRTFPEQPNYDSIKLGDAPATYFFVYPDYPLCVAEGRDDDGLEPLEPAVSAIQLVFRDGAHAYHRLRPHLGKPIICWGRLYHAQTGHHHSPVLLADARCQPHR